MHCIGVDVSKQELVTFDGTRERVFRNEIGVAEFNRFLKGRRMPFWCSSPRGPTRGGWRRCAERMGSPVAS
jgi:hypothetical protein